MSPFLCDIQRAITLAPRPPYTEIPQFLAENIDLVEPALDTLRYVDCALLGPPDHRGDPGDGGADG